MSNSDANPPPKVLKRKSVDYVIERVPRPTPVLDIMKMFQANSNIYFEVSNSWTIDVFPNMIPIIMLIILTSIRDYGLVTNREYSKITPSTLCMYYLSIVYGYFLINDLEVRPQTSAHARPWKDCSYKRDFTNVLRSLPVPEFLTVILSQFHATETDRTRNVYFVPSAAGFDHNQFFGRLFPVNFFAEVHDCLATLSSSSSLNQILQYLYTRPLYTIGDDFTCLIPDLIGVTLDRTTATTANYMNSKLFQVCNCLFNPALFRDVQRRPTLAALSFQAPVYETADINAYDLMFAATPNNLRELQVVLQAVAAVLDPIPTSGRLDSFIAEKSGNAILMHGYSSYALPTWSHGEETAKVTSFGAFTMLTRVSPTSRARDFSFLQRPAAAIPTTHAVTDVIYAAATAPDIAVDLPTGHVLTRRFPGSLRANTNAAHPFPRYDDTSLIHFDDAYDVCPHVLVLDTEGNQGINAYLATLTGKIIESFELDGTVIEIPTVSRPVGVQNCLFADSAIPYRYVRPGSEYHPRAVGSVLPPLSRSVPPPSTRLTAASILHSRNSIMLPRFQNNINDVLGTTLPGMTATPGAISAAYCQSMIGFNCCDGNNNANANDNVPAMPTSRLLLWSPYTYTPYEGANWPVPDYADSRHYYLTNLRTIFGTDYNLVEVDHPYQAFPVV